MGIVGIVAAALLLGAALFVWMVFVEPRAFRVRRTCVAATRSGKAREVFIEHPGLAGLTILHVTDTHFMAGDEAKVRFLRRVGQEKFDLVLFTGDLIDTPQGVEPCVEAAACLHGRLGAFAVLGGHDYFQGGPWYRHLPLVSGPLTARKHSARNPAESLAQRLEETGVQVLRDEHRLITLPDGARAALVGLEDAFNAEPDYAAAWAGVPAGIPVIVISHSPDALPQIVNRGAHLVFFGHTHGGQVHLPFIGALTTRCSLPTSRASGTFKEGHTVFSINNGLGGGRHISFRLLCPPEVTALRVIGRKGNGGTQAQNRSEMNASPGEI